MPRSVVSAAGRNRDALRVAVQRLLRSDQTGRLRRFRALVATSAFSSNVSADKVTTFDEAGMLLDSRRLEQHRLGGDRRAGLRAFRASQGPWYRGRVRFEALWQHGRQFVYGAVNAGGMGTEGHFGPFCLVVGDPDAHAPKALAVFPGNSVERYCSPAGVVDGARAASEVAHWSDRADAAVRELCAEILAAAEDEWPGVLCHANRFLEVVIGPPPPLSALSAVRVRDAYRERLDDLEGRALGNDTLQGTERREVAAFEVLNRWRRVRAVTLESVG